MFENHMLQMFDTRELEMRARLGERRVDLVPPFRRNDQGALSRIAGSLWSRVRRQATPTRRSAAPLRP